MTRGRTVRLVAIGTGIAAALVVALVIAMPARRRAVEAYGKQVKAISKAYRDALTGAARAVAPAYVEMLETWEDAAGQLAVDEPARMRLDIHGSVLESSGRNSIPPFGTFQRSWHVKLSTPRGEPLIDVAVDASWGWRVVPTRPVAVVTDAGAPENKRVLDLLLLALDAAGVHHRLERRSP